jgi:hypothetical protein
VVSNRLYFLFRYIPCAPGSLKRPRGAMPHATRPVGPGPVPARRPLTQSRAGRLARRAAPRRALPTLRRAPAWRARRDHARRRAARRARRHAAPSSGERCGCGARGRLRRGARGGRQLPRVPRARADVAIRRAWDRGPHGRRRLCADGPSICAVVHQARRVHSDNRAQDVRAIRKQWRRAQVWVVHLLHDA